MKTFGLNQQLKCNIFRCLKKLKMEQESDKKAIVLPDAGALVQATQTSSKEQDNPERKTSLPGSFDGLTMEFNSKLEEAGERLVVVDFFADWCGPCKIIGPKLEELSNQLGDKVVIIKVDVDACDDLAASYGISSMPTFVFIKNKETVWQFSGANYEKLKASIEKFLQE